jgi:hypothetical protein
LEAALCVDSSSLRALVLGARASACADVFRYESEASTVPRSLFAYLGPHDFHVIRNVRAARDVFSLKLFQKLAKLSSKK